MNPKLDSLLGRMEELETEMRRELRQEAAKFRYAVHGRKVTFTEEANVRNRQLAKRLQDFVRDTNFWSLLTAPVIYGAIVPIALLDATFVLYQAICFPIYGIPKVRRRDHLLFDRKRLAYLNVLEKLNCQYCAYANGVIAFTTEVAGRTEQYWCPIKHALPVRSMHSRYRYFFDYGDAVHYRAEVEKLRRAFADVE
jgi:hypothetical protein